MQRWFFGDDNSDSTSNSFQPNNASTANNTSPKNGRTHTFRVLVNQKLEPNEQVAVTGECSVLGHWLPAKCVQLNRENGESFSKQRLN